MMEALPCPVLETYMNAVFAFNPSGAMNKDLLDQLTEEQHRAQQERVDISTSRLRALRAFELSYNAILSKDLRNIDAVPPVRAHEKTLDWYLSTLNKVVEDAIVFNVELSLGAEEPKLRSPALMKKIEMVRIHTAGVRLLDSADALRFSLLNDDRRKLGTIGSTLGNVCKEMAIGLSVQVTLAQDLMRPR